MAVRWSDALGPGLAGAVELELWATHGVHHTIASDIHSVIRATRKIRNWNMTTFLCACDYSAIGIGVCTVREYLPAPIGRREETRKRREAFLVEQNVMVPAEILLTRT